MISLVMAVDTSKITVESSKPKITCIALFNSNVKLSSVILHLRI